MAIESRIKKLEAQANERDDTLYLEDIAKMTNLTEWERYRLMLNAKYRHSPPAKPANAPELTPEEAYAIMCGHAPGTKTP